MDVKGYLCIVLLIGVFSHAQQTKKEKDVSLTDYLEEVVVTDSRFQFKRSVSGKPIIKITSEDLIKNPSQSVLDILNQKAGIEINGARSGRGQNLGYFIRGGSTSQVLILMDGISITNPGSFSPNYDLRFLSIANVESIEILKGASASLYGSSATSAVINIITKQPTAKSISGSLSTIFGTNQSFDHQDYKLSTTRNILNVNGSLKKFTYTTAMGYEYTDGLSAAIAADTNESDIFSKYNIDIRLGYRGEKLKVKGFLNYNSFKNDSDGGSFIDNTKEYAYNDQYRIGTNLTYSYKGGSLQANIAHDNYHIDFRGSYPSETKAGSYISDIYNKYIFHRKFYTILGLENQYFSAKLQKENKNISQNALYTNMVYISDFGLNLNLGFRVNSHSEYGTNIVYQLNPSYNIKLRKKSLLKFFGSYGTSFIAPVIMQLFHPEFGNKNLKPETSQNVELGVSANNPKWRVSVVYFDRNLHNKIGYDSKFKNINLDSNILASGIELESQYKASKRIDITLNYTLTNIDKKKTRIPKNKTHLSVNYSIKHTNIYFSFDHIGTRGENRYDPKTFSSTLISLRAYSLVNIGASQMLFGEHFKTSITLENILNEEYMEIYGYSTRGRNLLIGLRYSF